MELEEKLKEIEKLSDRKNKIERFLKSSERKLALTANDVMHICLTEKEERLKNFIQEYFIKELQEVDEKLNKLLK